MRWKFGGESLREHFLRLYIKDGRCLAALKSIFDLTAATEGKDNSVDIDK